MKLIENIGVFLLSVWLIIVNALTLFDLRVPNWNMIYGALVLLTGIFLFFRLNDPKAYVNVGMFLLALFLLVTSALMIFNTNFPSGNIILAFTAALAGVFFVPVIFEQKNFYNLGMFMTGIWLILSNVLPMVGIAHPYLNFGLVLWGMLASLFLLMGL